MKTAISLPDELFADAEKLAAAKGVSRSQLYQDALREYLQRHDPEAVTAAWNALVAAETAAEPDPFAQAAAVRTLAEVEW